MNRDAHLTFSEPYPSFPELEHRVNIKALSTWGHCNLSARDTFTLFVDQLLSTLLNHFDRQWGLDHEVDFRAWWDRCAWGRSGL